MDTAALMLSCDWGTTSLRLRLASFAAAGQIIAEFRGGDGIARIAAKSQPHTRGEFFKQSLRQAIRSLQASTEVSLDSLPIAISGMASSSIGWQSLPYANLPFDLSGKDAVCADLRLDEHAVLLISGVRADSDVMRGEETELIGLMQLPEMQAARRRCVAILPGTHSKHVEIVGGKIASFRTFMTGEVFSVLSTQSILRHSISAGDKPITLPPETDGPQFPAFIAGVGEAMENDLLAALFQVRARQLLDNQPPQANAAFLSGVLIGSEISALRHRQPVDDPIVLCGGSAVSGWYAAALQAAGLCDQVLLVPPEKVDQLSMMGHARVYEVLGSRSGR
ncbi:MAG TPA: 2-dehydro-3-deoxygalactonokinase [Tepidisphaeraceae bacterium]|nr:2-dehydro-3-deoxygalactonokinase [Tepidisphaeraceae bacterium]